MKNSKKYKIISARLWMMWFLFFILPSCSEDNLSTPDIPDEAESYGYISLIINLADDEATTRSVFDSPVDNTGSGLYVFNEGLDQEKAVANNPDAHWVLAYDNNQNIISRLQLEYLQEYSQTGSNKATAYKGVCKVPLTDPFLSSINNMRVILNASETLQGKLKRGEDIRLIDINNNIDNDNKNIDNLFYNEGEYKYHTMTTAMVLVNNRLTPSSDLVRDNKTGQLKVYDTFSEALGNPSVTLYVERLQSKFTVLFNNNGIDYYFKDGNVFNSSNTNSNKTLVFSPSNSDNKLKVVYAYNNDAVYDTYNWKASIVGWSINATEPEEYLFKYFGININSYSYWNYPSTGTPIRNIWTVDNNYSYPYEEKYPDQYRQAFDKIYYINNFSSESDNQDNNDKFTFERYDSSKHPLKYFSFSDLSKRNIREYQGENTYSATQAFSGIADPLGNLAHLRCGSHLIICAQLLVQGIDETAVYNSTDVDKNGLISGVKDKFFTDNQYWTKEAYIDYFKLQMGYNMKVTNNCISDYSSNFVPNDVFKPSETNPSFYVKNGGRYEVASTDDFEIVPAEIVGGDGWCFPYPKTEGDNTILYVKTGSGTGDQNFQVITNDQYKKLVYGNTIYFAKHYKEGRMYYALPIMHDPGRNDEVDFGHRTGDYGMVRNNWYHFKIDGVASPGTPVDDPSQPIIPNNEPSAKGLGFEVMIIPWHIVEEDVNI